MEHKDEIETHVWKSNGFRELMPACGSALPTFDHGEVLVLVFFALFDDCQFRNLRRRLIISVLWDA
jgi:hypothetical protein